MKFLIVGLGSMGKRRIRNLQYLQAGELVGCDTRADRREEAATRYGVETVAGLDEGFARQPDAVIISTPPDLHVVCAREAARRGLHFFTEAGVMDEGIDEVLALLRRQPGVVGVPSCTMRYQAGPRAIKAAVKAGTVGTALSFVYQSGQYLPDWHPWEDYRTFYVSRRATGACREIVPFELVWLTDVLGPIRSVTAFRGKLSDLETDIDDVYQCLLEFVSGVRGVLQVDVLARAPVRHFRLLGSHGTVEWDAVARDVRVYTAATREWTRQDLASGTVEKGYAEWSAEEPYVAEMRDFVAAVRGQATFPHSFEEDGRLLRVLEAAEDSAVHGGRVVISESAAPSTSSATMVRS